MESFAFQRQNIGKKGNNKEFNLFSYGQKRSNNSHRKKPAEKECLKTDKSNKRYKGHRQECKLKAEEDFYQEDDL